MRLSTGIRLAHGVVLLIAPNRMSRALTGVPLDGPARAAARLLGVREVGQALLTARTGSVAVRRIGRAVDGLHALSMIALAVVSPRRRRLALASSAVATLFLVGGAGDAALPVVDERSGPDRADSDAGPPPIPAERGEVRRRREFAAQRQQAIRDVLRGSKGQPVERVKDALRRALAVRGASPQPEPWINAVASDAARGHIYVVNQQAMADTGDVLPRAIRSNRG
jgi:hypothetical protein